MFTKEWIRSNFNIQEKIDNAYLKGYDRLFNRAQQNYNSYTSNYIVFSENPNLNEEVDSSPTPKIIFTKEQNIQNVQKQNNEIFEYREEIPYRNLFVNENCTKYYNTLSKKWETITDDKFKNHFAKYTQFFTKKEELLNDLKTINFEKKYINTNINYIDSLDDEISTQIKESEILKIKKSLLYSINRQCNIDYKKFVFKAKILFLTEKTYNLRSIDLDSVYFFDLKILNEDKNSYSIYDTPLITSKNHIIFEDDTIKLKVENKYFPINTNNEYLQKLLELYKA